MDKATATWHVIKYLPDIRRREPRNVGLVLATPDGWLTKFVGEAEDGEIKGNRIKGNLDLEIYKTWVEYYRRKASQQRWDDVERLQRRRRENYFAETGGVIYDPEGKSWAGLLSTMFTELIQDHAEKTSLNKKEYLLEQARTALSIANIQVDEKVEVSARFGDRLSTVPFEFRQAGGSYSLMDAVNINGQNPAALTRELRARIVAARAAKAAANFFTFFMGGEHTEDELDALLIPLEEESFPIDVTDSGNAADKLAELARR